jgi:hypothetical protein
MSITIDEVRSTPTKKITAQAILGEKVQVSPGVLDAAAAYLFSHGQCTSLAIALSRRLSAPLKLVIGQWSEIGDYLTDAGVVIDGFTEIPSDVIDEEWYHVVVEVGDDEYLDISGVASSADILMRYFNAQFEGLLVPTSEDQIYELCGMCEGTAWPDVRVAELFVDAVLSKFLSK